MPNASDVQAFSLQWLVDVLNDSIFEAAYDHFTSAPALPFVRLSRAASENLFADDKVFERINRWQIFLCTELKSTDTERALEQILTDNGICFEVVDETFVKDENIYQIIYEFEEVEE